MKKKTGDRRLGKQAGGWKPEARGVHLLLGLFLLTVLAFPGAYAAQPEHAPEGAAKEHAPAGEHEAESPWATPLKVLNFIALFGLLGYLLRKPAGEFFAGRTRAIQQGIAEARQARQAAAKRLAEIEHRLERLGDEIKVLREEAWRESAAQRERLRASAGAEADKILANAEAEINALARAARLELKSYTAQLAVEMAEERIKNQMNPEVQSRILRTYVQDLGDQNRGNGEK